MDGYRLLKKKMKNKQEENKIKKFFVSLLNQILICTVLLLVALIAAKDQKYKDKIYQYVYEQHFSFSEIEKYYQKYFGTLIPQENKQDDVELASSEGFQYKSLEEIENGVKVKVGTGEIVPALESGLVLFTGEKEGFGTTLILEQVDGVEAWYVGVDIHDLSLYDYVEKSSIIGVSKDEEISLYFKKKGENIDYKNYLS